MFVKQEAVLSENFIWFANKKRKYKRKRNSTESLQDSTEADKVVQSLDQPCSSAQAQAQEISSNNSNISESFNLVLEEENISNLTFDEYDSLVPQKDYYWTLKMDK